MITVTELAKQAKVTPDTVRHYVHIGLLEPERNPKNGYKVFAKEDVRKVQFIRQAKRLGFTLSEAREILKSSMNGDSPCPQVREIIQRRINENREKLESLNALQERMENALKAWNTMPDGSPNGDSICHLIEFVVPLETVTKVTDG